MQNSHKKRKRKNYSLYYILIIFFVVVIFVILSLTVFFRAENVVVTGTSIYNVAEITNISKIKGGDNIILVNTKKIEANILKNLNYIEAVEVSRAFPNSVKITVTPSIESTNVKVEDEYYVLSQSNKILAVRENPIENISTIVGATKQNDTKVGEEFVCDDERKTDILYKLVDVTRNSYNGALSYFDMTDHHNIENIYDDRIQIKFGAITDFDYKLRFAEKIIETKIGPETKGVLTLLEDGASFVDEAGVEQNKQTYLANLEKEVFNDKTVEE